MYVLQQWFSFLEYMHGSIPGDSHFWVGASGPLEEEAERAAPPHTNQKSVPSVCFL